MAKLIYSMLTSLDGYTEDQHGHFGWGAPEDEVVHSYVNELASSLGTCLYGRRMYETMVYWETAHAIPANRSSCSTGRASGGPPKRSSTRGPSPNRGAHGRASRGSSIPTRFGGSRPTPIATSVLTVRNSPHRR
jgi:hypothetical protein